MEKSCGESTKYFVHNLKVREKFYHKKEKKLREKLDKIRNKLKIIKNKLIECGYLKEEDDEDIPMRMPTCSEFTKKQEECLLGSDKNDSFDMLPRT